MLKKFFASLLVVGAISGLAGCGDQQTANNSAPPVANSPATTQTAANQVKVQTKEMAIEVSRKTVPAGQVEFAVQNVGKVPHEFVIFKTDLPLDKLPTESNGKLNENDKRLQKITEVEEDDLKPGTSKTVQVNMTPGKYVLICNVGKHFSMGMKTTMTVQ